jgi:hypothetical protein
MDAAHRSRRAEEAVLLALAGGLAVLSALAARERVDAPLPPALLGARSTPPDAPLATWSARELRSLPGIGATRAVEIVRARWEGRIAGTVDSLDDVRGIGPETVARVRAELQRRAHGARGAAALAEDAFTDDEEETP